jgi:hypothetical protein
MFQDPSATSVSGLSCFTKHKGTKIQINQAKYITLAKVPNIKNSG